MAKIKLHKYRMEPDSKFHVATTALMGLSFFLRAAYYFGFTRPEEAGIFELLMMLILPMVLEIGFMVMLRGLKLNLPGIFGIMGAVFCALLMIQSFCVGGVLRIILAIVGYLACGAALVGVGWGILSKSLGVTVLGMTFAVRLLAFDLKDLLGLHLVVFMREAAGLCAILALAFFCAGLLEKDKVAQKNVPSDRPVKKAPPKRKPAKKSASKFDLIKRTPTKKRPAPKASPKKKKVISIDDD